ncbi:MAG TPA: alpha/beta hydrolase [Acidimicrobiales bacterium]|nr:alpha/beta hydrolase [Acidimicrobiales bacterium]
MTTVVLVHGAFHGPWCFEYVRRGLEERDVRVVAPELPLTGAGDDAAVVAEALERIDDDQIVLLGHSYGGAVISRAGGADPRVRHLVYLCAIMVSGDDAVPIGTDPDSAIVKALVTGDGVMSVNPEFAAAAFYGDCDPDMAQAAVAKLRPMVVGDTPDMSSGDPPAWRSVPSTYVVCIEDRTIAPDDQRAMAANATNVVEWPTSHSPFFSQPDLVVDLLVDLAEAP